MTPAKRSEKTPSPRAASPAAAAKAASFATRLYWVCFAAGVALVVAGAFYAPNVSVQKTTTITTTSEGGKEVGRVEATRVAPAPIALAAIRLAPGLILQVALAAVAAFVVAGTAFRSSVGRYEVAVGGYFSLPPVTASDLSGAAEGALVAVKQELQQSAASTSAGAAPPATSARMEEWADLRDPKLRVQAFRLELERAVRRAAARLRRGPVRDLGEAIDAIRTVNGAAANSIQQLLGVLDGAETRGVDAAAAAWALDEGSELLRSLDALSTR